MDQRLELAPLHMAFDGLFAAGRVQHTCGKTWNFSGNHSAPSSVAAQTTARTRALQVDAKYLSIRTSKRRTIPYFHTFLPSFTRNAVMIDTIYIARHGEARFRIDLLLDAQY